MEREYFSQKIRALRKDKGLTQEQLAQELGLSVQAVSKWECAASYPDIEMLVRIAEYFGTGIGELLTTPPPPQEKAAEHPSQTAENSEKPTLPEGALSSLALPSADILCSVQLRDGRVLQSSSMEFPASDNALYVVQIYNGHILQADEYDPDSSISLVIPDDIQDILNVTVYGNISGDVNAGGNVTCGEVNGDVDTGGNATCGEVNGDMSAGGNVTCGDVGGDVDAGGNVACGDVDGDVDAGGNVTCGNVSGDVNADTVEQ